MPEPETLLGIASGTALAIGGALCVIGAIGLWRLPDVFARLHAASLIDTLGIGFLALGMALEAGLTLVTLKLVFIVVLVGITTPVATHALAQAALHAGQRPRLAHDLREDEEAPR